MSRWKIVDNLRRSTVELTQLLFLIAGWTVLPGSPVRWTLLGLGAIVAPWVAALLRAALLPPLDKSFRGYYGEVGRDAVVGAQQALLAVAVLPHQALLSLDAIGRTLYRLLVSRRRLLDWQSASVVAREQGATLAGTGLPTMRMAAVLVLLGRSGRSASRFGSHASRSARCCRCGDWRDSGSGHRCWCAASARRPCRRARRSRRRHARQPSAMPPHTGSSSRTS